MATSEEIISEQEIEQALQNLPQGTDGEGDAVFSPLEVDAAQISGQASGWEKFTQVTKELPVSMQNILFSGETKLFLQYDIGQAYRLSREQSAELSRIVRDVLLARTFVGNMMREISERLKVPQGTAQDIRDSIIAELFQSVAEEVKALHRQKFSDKTGESPSGGSQLETAQANSNTIDLRKGS